MEDPAGSKALLEGVNLKGELAKIINIKYSFCEIYIYIFFLNYFLYNLNFY